MARGYKVRTIKLRPNKQQTALLYRFAGAARFLYNFFIDVDRSAYYNFKAGYRPKRIIESEFHKAFKELIEKPDYQWLHELPINMVYAISHRVIHARSKAIKCEKINFPQYKKRSSRDQFMLGEFPGTRLRPNKFLTIKRRVHIKMTEAFPSNLRARTFTIMRKGDDWYVAIMYRDPEHNKPQCKDPESVVGIDVGVRHAATLSDGTTYTMPDIKNLLKRYDIQLTRWQHTQIGSNRFYRWKKAASRTLMHIGDINRDATHKITTDIAKNHGIAVLERISVKAMMQTAPTRMSRRLIRHACMKTIQKQLARKMQKCYAVSNRFQSSKRCCMCWHVGDIDWTKKTYKCPECGSRMDRDLNAAKNLFQEYFSGRVTAVASRASGEGIPLV